MPDQALSYEGFIETVDPRYQPFARELHAHLLDCGCKLKLQTAKSGGYIVSYQHGKSKRVLLNFVFRKSGLVARIYGDHTQQYADFLNSLPEQMVKAIEKSGSECKLCNARCPKGYVFSIQDKSYSKCRYNCFMFPVDEDSIPYIEAFIKNEMVERDNCAAG